MFICLIVCWLASFDELVRALGKSLPLKIYGLISYIEKNVFDNNEEADQQSTGQGNKAKVIRETRAIPKLIMRIENFNKFVICLGQKTKSPDLSKRLHLGTVRDFRIKTSELKDAINRTIEEASAGNDVDMDDDELDDGADGGDDVADNDNEHEDDVDGEESNVDDPPDD